LRRRPTSRPSMDEDMTGRFRELVDGVRSAADLAEAMAAISRRLGFPYFALTHHVDPARSARPPIRMHNYPERWADHYDRHGLGVSDPVHRASHVTSIGFRWSRMPEMIPLTTADRRILALGAAHGVGDGFTVPAHVPGEARGSCSFAIEAGHAVQDVMLPQAQLAGTFAFEAARRFWSPRGRRAGTPAARLTDRQRDCVMWIGQGKTDWEISRILGVTEETVRRHVKLARERLGVSKRTLLAIRALFDGSLSFSDVLRQ